MSVFNVTVDQGATEKTITVVQQSSVAGIPIGGTTGQALVKSSNANYDTEFATLAGDMTKAVYDPLTVEGDAFDMDNMAESSTKKILTSDERTIIATVPDLEMPIGIACSDETTDLEVLAAASTFRMPFAMTLTKVRANVNTAPTDATIIIDIKESGTTILSTKITIDATEKTSETAATPAVISDANLADDAEITINIDQIGSTIAGAGLKVWLIGTRA